MASTWRISIRSKILFVLSAVVIAAVSLYLYLASRIFYEDKTLLIYELNQTKVSTLGADVESNLKRLIEKLRLVAASPQILNSISGKDEDFVRIGAYRRNSDGTLEHRVLGTWPETLQLNAFDASYLDTLRDKIPVPFDEVLKNAYWVRNATLPVEGAPALMTVAARIDGGSTDEVYYADVRLESMIQEFIHEGVAKAYLIDSQGFTLADPEQSHISHPEDLSHDPLIQIALQSKLRSEVKKFQGPDGTNYLGAFFRTSIPGVTVVSKIATEEAFAAARILIRKSLLYASIVITSAFLIALFFSHTLTAPIFRLVEATRRVAQGDFKLVVPATTHDELATLAVSFNSMTNRLEETRHQLVESEKMAAVGQVARAIGHEFGNLLQAIMGKADLALTEKDPEKLREKLELILKAADKATIIVRNLQSFSKSASSPAPVALPKAIEATLSLVNHELKKNNVVPIVNASPQTPPVLAIGSELEQVLLNLVINATHAMQPKGGNLEIGCGPSADGKEAQIWVQDTGSGIPPEVLPRIFEFAFTTKGNKGTGLGLAICKDIVQKHQGRIDVQTQLGQGTRFILTFPRISDA